MVIQGETKHFDYVCKATTEGIMKINLEYNSPVIFCLLTDQNVQQSIDRSGGKHGNKGIECAIACLKMIELKKSFVAELWMLIVELWIMNYELWIMNYEFVL